MRTNVWLWAIGLALLHANAASAKGYPAECADGSDASGYRAGLFTGQSLAVQAWNRLGQDCDQMDRPQQLGVRVLDTTDFPSDANDGSMSKRLACRFGGHVDGTMNEVNERAEACGAQCCGWGTSIGNTYAHALCLVSIAAKGTVGPGDYVRPDVPWCGTHFETCCDSAAYYYARGWAACRRDVPPPHEVNFDHYLDFTSSY